MKLHQFNGGLNLKAAPSHIAVNESVVCNNVDTSSQIIKPIKEDTKSIYTAPADNSAIYKYSGAMLTKANGTEFVEFNGKLYYYNDAGKLIKWDGSTEYALSTDAPAAALSCAYGVPFPTFSIFQHSGGFYFASAPIATTLFYKIVCTYADGSRYYEDIQSYNNPTQRSVEVSLSPVLEFEALIQDMIVYRLWDDGIYRKVGQASIPPLFYTSDIGASLFVLDNIWDISANEEYNTGLMELPDSREYCYTYYRSTDGAESAPSPIDWAYTLVSNDVDITGFVAPADASFDYYRLYRRGGDLATFTMVDELLIPVGEPLNDLNTDLAIANNGTLTTEGLIAPPDNLSYLTLHVATLFAVTGGKLWFSEQGLVDQWNPYYYLQFDKNITGLASTQNGLIIFTKNSTYILTGTNASTFVVHLISNSQGCVAHSTIQYVENSVVWLSLDGICASYGSKVDVISEPKLGKLSLTPYDSAFYEQQYYLFHSTGVLVLDFRNGGLVFKTIDLIAKSAHYSSEDDKLYYVDSIFDIYEFGTAATDRTLSFKTGRLFVSSLTDVKVFKNIYLFVEGSVALTLTAYDKSSSEVVSNVTLVEGFNDVKWSVTNLRAYYIELAFSGTGKVYEIEFKFAGRQNGR